MSHSMCHQWVISSRIFELFIFEYIQNLVNIWLIIIRPWTWNWPWPLLTFCRPWYFRYSARGWFRLKWIVYQLWILSCTWPWSLKINKQWVMMVSNYKYIFSDNQVDQPNQSFETKSIQHRLSLYLFFQFGSKYYFRSYFRLYFRLHFRLNWVYKSKQFHCRDCFLLIAIKVCRRYLWNQLKQKVILSEVELSEMFELLPTSYQISWVRLPLFLLLLPVEY